MLWLRNVSLWILMYWILFAGPWIVLDTGSGPGWGVKIWMSFFLAAPFGLAMMFGWLRTFAMQVLVAWALTAGLWIWLGSGSDWGNKIFLSFFAAVPLGVVFVFIDPINAFFNELSAATAKRMADAAMNGKHQPKGPTRK